MRGAGSNLGQSSFGHSPNPAFAGLDAIASPRLPSLLARAASAPLSIFTPALAPALPRQQALPQRRHSRRGWQARLTALARVPGLGTFLVVVILASTGIFGAVRGGEYDAFVAAEGSVPDVAARLMGFGISAITISGEKGLSPTEILADAGISTKNSMLFLDVAAVRDRLKQVPLIADASVRKLYPDRIVIDITEREPAALWQHEGTIDVVASDGTPIDELRDQHATDLPFVVGDGANAHVDEFAQLLTAAQDVRSQIRAGIYVGGRRWDLKLTDGLEVELPEENPVDAVTRFVKLVHQQNLLSKDLISADFRLPDRVALRLGADAAAARAAALAKKPHPKGGPT